MDVSPLFSGESVGERAEERAEVRAEERASGDGSPVTRSRAAVVAQPMRHDDARGSLSEVEYEPLGGRALSIGSGLQLYATLLLLCPLWMSRQLRGRTDTQRVCRDGQEQAVGPRFEEGEYRECPSPLPHSHRYLSAPSWT